MTKSNSSEKENILLLAIYEKLNFLEKIKFKQLNKVNNKLPKIPLKGLSREIKLKLTDEIIGRYCLKKMSKGKKKGEGSELLIKKTKEGQLEVVKYLVSIGANIHTNNEEALKWSAWIGNIEIVKYLVSLGADIHENNEEALKCSIYNQHIEVTEYLISIGAKKPKRVMEYVIWLYAKPYWMLKK